MNDPNDERRGETMAVPYAPLEFECGMAYVDCPMCGARIGLAARKDFESYSMSEYAAHVAATHPERVVSFGSADERDGSSTVDEWNDPAFSGIRIANAAQRLFNAGELPTRDAIEREIRKGAHR
jgi:hypothetical protein